MLTRVAIIGAGPAGSLLAHLLQLAGIDSVVIERQSRDYVLGRIRAGVLEWGTVQTLRKAGLSQRMDAEGKVHDHINIAWRGSDVLSVNTRKRVGKQMMAYGQTQMQHDLYEAADRSGTTIVFETSDARLHDITSSRPSVTFRTGSGVRASTERLECDFIAGCDGFHGVSRSAIPQRVRRDFHKEYPFGWLGILSETPPLPMLMYVNHRRGFALCSQRGATMSRYYVQCPLSDTVADWPDDRFWTELLTRVPSHKAEHIQTGPSIEKSIAPLRSFVSEPMSYGRLYLAGDAAHIMPPTGAKGLNLAVSDVYYLARALTLHYAHGDDRGLELYSEMALRRVWGAARFSWWLTRLLHRFPDQTDFDQRAQEQEISYLASSPAAQTAMSEQYVGLPYEDLPDKIFQ